jgi:hypothetical protein
MTSASNVPPYQNPGYQHPAWGPPSNNQGPGWFGPWHPAGFARPAIIALVVFLLAAGHIGRLLFWPVALAALVFMVASGRLGCRRRARWAQAGGQQNENAPPWGRAWRNWCGGDQNPTPPPSGNHAFDEYRAETLRRLEEEQSEFSSYLERLRFAKDEAEFDQFMAERRQTPRPPAVPEEPTHG